VKSESKTKEKTACLISQKFQKNVCPISPEMEKGMTNLIKKTKDK